MRRSRNFTEYERQGIVAKSYCDNVTVISVSEEYGISRSTLFKWRRQYEASKQQSSTEIDSSNYDISVKERFLEVNLVANQRYDSVSQDVSSRKLHQKLSLNFDAISVNLDGYLTASSLLKIIKILETL